MIRNNFFDRGLAVWSTKNAEIDDAVILAAIQLCELIVSFCDTSWNY